MVSSWNSAKKYSRTLFGPSSQNSSKYENQMPKIPRGTISGLRTFIRRVQRTNTQSVHINELSTFATLNSETEQDYHDQLREISNGDIGRIADESLESLRAIK
ncbi:hypothetical protein F5Y13DRAFT_192014 [Hypoxylon sp. FL1857]|nr:hypothetical protein F5Y13DRAFT_192014 [Hypoxylon sp. FL1857]